MQRTRCQVLRALFQDEISVYRLIDQQDASLQELLQLIEQLQEEGLVYMQKGRAGLTAQGREYCSSKGLDIGLELACESCQGTGLQLPPFFQEILQEYKQIMAHRPEAVMDYDQGFMSAEGVLRRVAFVYARGDIHGRIFVVGDDDFFSIAAALTCLPQHVLAVDVDTRVVELINQTAQQRNLNLEARVCDVQQDLPLELQNSFDIFLSDPVETLPGLELFLSRGISALRGPGSAGYFGLTTLEASRSKWFQLQAMLQKMGFAVTDICRRFNVYPEEEKNFFSFQEELPIVKHFGTHIDYDWYKSSLHRIEAVQEPRPLVKGERLLEEKVYKDEESLATPF